MAQRSGSADLPLHGGRVPEWLAGRMTKLGAVICEADGTVVARRDRTEGEGLAIGEIEPGRRQPLARTPDGFWLHRRGGLAALTWNYQRIHGRRWYRRHVRGRPASTVKRKPASVAG